MSKLFLWLINAILASRLTAPRRFIQALAGRGQVGKTTLVQQVCERIGFPVQFAAQPNLQNETTFNSVGFVPAVLFLR